MCLCTDFFCLISFVIYEKISSFAKHDSNAYHFNHYRCHVYMGQGEGRHCGTYRPGSTPCFRNSYSHRSSCRLFFTHRHHDDWPLCGGWGHHADWSCQVDGQQTHGAFARQRNRHLPLGDACHLVYRSLCQQYGYGGSDDAHHRKPCRSIRLTVLTFPHAPCLCR